MRVVRKIVVRIRKPVHILLALVPSSEEGKPDYKICLDRFNLVFCTCPSWRYRGHTCKHLTAFRESLESAA